METAKLLPLAFEPQDTRSAAAYLQGLLTQQGHFTEELKFECIEDPADDQHSAFKFYAEDKSYFVYVFPNQCGA